MWTGRLHRVMYLGCVMFLNGVHVILYVSHDISTPCWSKTFASIAKTVLTGNSGEKKTSTFPPNKGGYSAAPQIQTCDFTQDTCSLKSLQTFQTAFETLQDRQNRAAEAEETELDWRLIWRLTTVLSNNKCCFSCSCGALRLTQKAAKCPPTHNFSTFSRSQSQLSMFQLVRAPPWAAFWGRPEGPCCTFSESPWAQTAAIRQTQHLTHMAQHTTAPNTRAQRHSHESTEHSWEMSRCRQWPRTLICSHPAVIQSQGEQREVTKS